MQLSKAIIALSFAVFTSVAALPAHPDPKGGLDSKDGRVHTMDKDLNNMADRPMYKCKGPKETCQKKWKSKDDDDMKKKKSKDGDDMMKKKKKNGPKKVKGPKKEKKPEEGKPEMDLDDEKPEMGPKDMDDKNLDTKPKSDTSPPPPGTKPGKPDSKSPPGEKKPTPVGPPGKTDPLLEENPTAP